MVELSSAETALRTQLFNPALVDSETLILWLKVTDTKNKTGAAAGEQSSNKLPVQPSQKSLKRRTSAGSSMNYAEDDNNKAKVRYFCVTCIFTLIVCVIAYHSLILDSQKERKDPPS